MKYDLIIGIDPAGIGSNGIVIYSNETNNIVFNETFKTKTVLESESKNKNKIENYKGNMKFTKHEQDAYKHIQYYLRNYKNERQSKLCQINSKTE